MTDEVCSLIQFRFKRARTAFRDGVSLMRRKSFESAVNRFYYGAFYAARALLATKGLDASKHSGVISLFHQHFVKSGLFDKEIARALSRSFERRIDSDYGDFLVVNGSEALQVQKEVEQFISACRSFYRQQAK